MEEQLNELKDFFGSLPENSPIGKSLQNLADEVKRVVETAEKERKQEATKGSEPSTSEETAGNKTDGNDANEIMTNDDDNLDTAINDTNGSDITKDDDDTDDTTPEWKKALEDLIMDDEFIAASVGFLIGAVTVGLGVTLVSAFRK